MLGRNELIVWCVNGHRMTIPLYEIDKYLEDNLDYDVVHVNVLWKCTECNAETRTMLCDVPRG